MDAAEKMGVDGYGAVPPQVGWWLAQRGKRGFGTQPSTWRRGLEDA